MKKNIVNLAMAIATVAIALVACKKAGVNPVITTDYEIEEIALQASNPVEADEVTADEASGNFELENEGINPNYWVEASDWDLEQGPNGGADATAAKRKRIINKSFIYCLRKLDLSDRQVAAIRTLLGEYQDCKASAISRARAIYNNLLQPYKDKFKRLHAAYRAGKITEDQFRKATAELRIAFVKELRQTQLKEKLNTALQNCHRTMLGKLKNILTDKQWKAFINCVK